MTRKEADIQLKKDVKSVISKISKSYQYYKEVEFSICTFDEILGLAFHFQKKPNRNAIHLVPLALGCESKFFMITKMICWTWEDDIYKRTTHLPGECKCTL